MIRFDQGIEITKTFDGHNYTLVWMPEATHRYDKSGLVLPTIQELIDEYNHLWEIAKDLEGQDGEE